MKKPLRVCLAFFRNEFTLSGEAQSFLALVKQMHQSKDLHVDVYVPFTRDSKIFDKTSKHGSQVFSRFFKLLPFLYTLIKKSKHYDALHVRFPTPSFLIFGDLLKLFSSCKIIVSFDSTYIDVPLLPLLQHNFFFYLPRIFINNKYLAMLSLKKADAYIVSSKYQSRQLVYLGISPSNISVIPNMIPANFLKSANRAAARKHYRFGKEQIILYIGHFTPTKGVDLLLRAYAHLQTPNTRLVLAYSGIGNKDAVEQLARHLGIRYTLLSKIDVHSLLTASDVLALPYTHTFATHSHPNLLLESFAVGIPVVTSALPLTEEFTALHTACFSFTPSNVGSLTHQLSSALAQTKQRAKIIASQKLYFNQHFSLAASAKKTLAVYTSVMKSKLY